MKVTGNQIKAARVLVGLEQTVLADTARVSVNTVRNMEAAGSSVVRVRLDTLLRVQEALDRAGVIFLADGEMTAGGPGVRLRNQS